MTKNSDIEYTATELIDRVDQLAIDDFLRAKIMWDLYKSLESEETLESNCKKLDLMTAEPLPQDLSELSMLDLGMRLNNLMIAGNEINIEYNRVINEIKKRESKLQNDPNLQLRKVRK